MRGSDRWKYIINAGYISGNILLRGRYDFEYDLMPVHAKDMSFRKRYNLLRTGCNLFYRRAHTWAWPIHIHIELTNYCNLQCRVCPTGIGGLERQKAYIEPVLFEKLMNDIGPYLLTTSMWGWGEPLLHPNLNDILRITQNRGITTFLSTNGQNLNDEKVLHAMANYPPTYLLVCLDGITDETNSAFRVGAKLAPALEGVRKLVSLRSARGSQLPVIHMRYIVMKHNEHEVPGIKEFAEENEFDEVSVRTLSIIDAPDDIHRDLIPEKEEFRAYGYRGDQREIRKDFICEKAFTFPAVFADGTVVACDQDCNASQPYGRFSDDTAFADIWWNRRSDEIRKIIRDNPQEFSFCSNCPFRDRPVGDCSVQYHDLR